MNPLQYWKALTEWKSREIAYLDRGHEKNPHYWEAKFRLTCDALNCLTDFKQNWMGPLRNLCSPTENIPPTISSSSASQNQSSRTSPPTSAEPDFATMSLKPIRKDQDHLQTTNQSQSRALITGDAQYHNPRVGRRSARLALKRTQSRPPEAKPPYLYDKIRQPGLLRGSERKRNDFDCGPNKRVSRRKGG